jgi:hypothetical protein
MMQSASPRLRARVAGAFYLVTAVCTGFSELARDKVTVRGDAAATAHNILASEQMYRLGFATDILGVAGYVVVTLLLYDLLKPVNAALARLAVFFSLISIVIQAISDVGHVAPLLLLGDTHYLSVFNANQLQAMSLMALQLHLQGFLISLVFFGFYCVVVGYLVFKSTFFPRTLGVLMAIAGLGYLANSFLKLLAPTLANTLPDFIFITGLGELAFMLWLLVFGLDATKWEAGRTAYTLGASRVM